MLGLWVRALAGEGERTMGLKGWHTKREVAWILYCRSEPIADKRGEGVQCLDGCCLMSWSLKKLCYVPYLEHVSRRSPH